MDQQYASPTFHQRFQPHQTGFGVSLLTNKEREDQSCDFKHISKGLIVFSFTNLHAWDWVHRGCCYFHDFHGENMGKPG